jgi:hypothetical protein
MTSGMSADRHAATEWIDSDRLADLVRCSGGEIPNGSLEHRIAWLLSFSDRWNYRCGAERFVAAEPVLDVDLQVAIFEAAASLGLRGERTTRLEQCDLLVVLGGLVHACFRRPQYAARVLQCWPGTDTRVIGLAGRRQLSDNERAVAANEYGVLSAESEERLLEVGLARSFAIGGQDHDAEVLVAPEILGARPSTAASLRHAIDTLPVQEGTNVVLVTTDIYVPYQYFTSARLFEAVPGVSFEVLGVANDFHASHYLQEIRSTLQAIGRLFDLQIEQ